MSARITEGNYLKKRSVGNTPYRGQTKLEPKGWAYPSRLMWHNEHGQTFVLPNRKERREKLRNKRPHNHYPQHVPVIKRDELGRRRLKWKTIWHHNITRRSNRV